MSDEAKKRSKELLARKLAAATGRRVPGSSPPPRRPSPPPAAPPRAEPADRDTLLRGLATSLKNVAAVTGGINRAKRHLEDARAAEAEGNFVSAANSLRLATALAPERQDLAAEYERVSKALAATLADTYEKQGQYEERMNRWAEAALSWAKVCEGRPADAHAHRRTAAAMLEAGGDLSKAKHYAQRAVDLLPEDARTRRTLGRVFFAAGMTLNAKRELEKSAKLDPSDEMVKNLLRELSQKKK
jgi:tetratricopeptide (TPR) repeat protein